MEAKQLIPPELYQRIFNNIAILFIEMRIARLEKLIAIKEQEHEQEMKSNIPEVVYL
jgi:predicted nucleotidyltransferase